MEKKCAIFWFRRDLRLEDNAGLTLALKSGLPVVPVFIFDEVILKKLPKRDSRVEFIQKELGLIDEELKSRGATLQVYHGKPKEIWSEILAEFDVAEIFLNEDYEPYARERDQMVAKLAEAKGAKFNAVKDQVIFAKSEVVKDDGTPYKVFTPYSRKWKSLLTEESYKTTTSHRLLEHCLKTKPNRHVLPSLSELGFEPGAQVLPHKDVKPKQVEEYAAKRNLMGHPATTLVGVHLRFGSVSTRKMVSWVKDISETYLNELIWREFFMQILYHFPHTVNEPFDPRYKNIEWRNDEAQFKKWCAGETGYDMVDAGMKELNETGFMHNRARMITASFLCKHLLIDWKWGERYFAEKLLDFELSSNVGNWQWAAGCGCDAAPYFRVFNPLLQAKKFDADGAYAKKWLGSSKRPAPIVDHAKARLLALATYKKALKGKES